MESPFLISGKPFLRASARRHNATMLVSKALALVVMCSWHLAGVTAACSLTCGASTTCYTAFMSDAKACWSGIPYNRTWQAATLDTIATSLENFGFGALYHETGPPYDLEIPLLEELRSSSVNSSFAR